LIDIGGYKLHLDCRGVGSPTVILEAGLNDFSVSWAWVQPEVARFTRVCTYDRAGLGWSELSPRPRTGATLIDELHNLLQQAGEAGPYLLVGHSFGGVTMRHFARQFPAEVHGLVLVDSAHEAQVTRIPTLRTVASNLQQQFQMLARLNSVGVLALAPTQIPDRGLPAAVQAQYRARLAASTFFTAANAESIVFYAVADEQLSSGGASLGDLPLIVISRGQAAPLPGLTAAENVEMERIWHELQSELASLSTNRQQQIAELSGHEIQLQQPELVVNAIRQLVSAR